MCILTVLPVKKEAGWAQLECVEGTLEHPSSKRPDFKRAQITPGHSHGQVTIHLCVLYARQKSVLYDAAIEHLLINVSRYCVFIIPTQKKKRIHSHCPVSRRLDFGLNFSCSSFWCCYVSCKFKPKSCEDDPSHSLKRQMPGSRWWWYTKESSLLVTAHQGIVN